jgi:hypothetical protein
LEIIVYKTPSVLARPHDSLQPLWRYYKYEYLKDLLESEELYFNHLRRFSDGLEGTLTERIRDKLFQWYLRQYKNDATRARQSLEDYEDLSNQFFVNCWHMNDVESYLMWKAYGDRGYAIRTTFERIQISFDRFEGEVNGGVVEYIDFTREAMQIGNIFTPVVKKDLPYRDEREFRLLLWRPDQANQSIAVSAQAVRVPVNLVKLIQKIYVNPWVKDVPSELSKLLERKNLMDSIVSSVVNEKVVQ